MEGYTYVYILRSKLDPNRHYTGLTNNLRRRLQEHNSGNVNHTAEFKPWVVKSAIAFEDAVPEIRNRPAPKTTPTKS
jgi:predicted GIY-YIG superfamily endonuclease